MSCKNSPLQVFEGKLFAFTGEENSTRKTLGRPFLVHSLDE